MTISREDHPPEGDWSWKGFILYVIIMFSVPLTVVGLGYLLS